MHDVCQGNAVGFKVISGVHSGYKGLSRRARDSGSMEETSGDLGLGSRCKRIQD